MGSPLAPSSSSMQQLRVDYYYYMYYKWPDELFSLYKRCVSIENNYISLVVYARDIDNIVLEISGI